MPGYDECVYSAIMNHAGSFPGSRDVVEKYAGQPMIITVTDYDVVQ